jgi:DNA cross-link repair 1C protein
VQGMIELMALLPQDTRFYINNWTWGYEDMLKAVATTFQCQVHVDRYKYEIFSKTSDPFLRVLVSRDKNASRFHACERFDRCDLIDFPPDTKGVVYVNPVGMSIKQWEAYRMHVKKQLEARETVTTLVSVIDYLLKMLANRYVLLAYPSSATFNTA